MRFLEGYLNCIQLFSLLNYRSKLTSRVIRVKQFALLGIVVTF